MEWEMLDNCPPSCPCWAQGVLPEPVTPAEAQLRREIEVWSRCRSRYSSARAQGVKQVAASVARGDLDKRRVAILFSALYTTTDGYSSWDEWVVQKTVLSQSLSGLKTSGFKCPPHGVPELIQLGVCLKTGFCKTIRSTGRLVAAGSPLQELLHDILTLHRVKRRTKCLHAASALQVLLKALKTDPVHIQCSISHLPDGLVSFLLQVGCHWVPTEKNVMRLAIIAQRWERRCARRAWMALAAKK